MGYDHKRDGIRENLNSVIRDHLASLPIPAFPGSPLHFRQQFSRLSSLLGCLKWRKRFCKEVTMAWVTLYNKWSCSLKRIRFYQDLKTDTKFFQGLWK